MNLCRQCTKGFQCKHATLIVGETTICSEYVEDEMLVVVNCKMCGNECLYGELIWLNGKCMCPTCYDREKMSTGGWLE